MCGTFYSYNSLLSPFAGLVSKSGRVGLTVGILGQGLNGSTGISFNGTAATTFTIVSDTYITAKVPARAATGLVVVHTPSGPLTSKQMFRVVRQQIKSFTPQSGPVGTQVIITGVSLTDASKVTFGGVSATFLVNSDTQVTATVPTGAKTGRIVITTPGGTAVSPTNFTVT